MITGSGGPVAAMTLEEVHTIEHPPEDLVKSSGAVILAGFMLLASVLILASFSWASRGVGPNGEPDLFGKHVTVREVAAPYRTSWAPGTFWPSKTAHSQVARSREEASPVFGPVWYFLTAWLGMSGVYLILVGAITEIEVFREQAHVRAAGCAALACCLCAVWPVLFRVGSHAPPPQMTGKQQVEQFNMQRGDHERTAAAPRVDRTKGVWLWIAFVVLVLAWALALAAAAQLQAWTLPGPPYGTLLFLAPGYGLLAGWLLYATFLNLGVAMSFDSYPDGVREVPADGNTAYINRGSFWPLLAAVIVITCAVLIPDPVQPLPMGVVLLLFTPRYQTNLGAAALCALGCGIAAWRIVELRDDI